MRAFRRILCACAAGAAALALLTPVAFAKLPEKVVERIRSLPIQHNGRLKPFDSFARESLEQITGSPSYGGDDPARTVASWISRSEDWQDTPLIAVPFVPLREKLGMDPHAKYISMAELMAERRLMKMLPAIVQKQQRGEKLAMLENETMDAFNRFVALSKIFEHDLAVVPPDPGSVSQVWRSLSKPAPDDAPVPEPAREAWSAFILALREASPDAEVKLEAARSALAAVNPSALPETWRIDWEIAYNRLKPFRAATWIYAMAALLLLISLARSIPSAGAAGIGALILAAAAHASGIGSRVILGGRPPVSNFYETMLWLPFVAVVLALIFEKLYRARVYALSASILAAIALALAAHVPLDSSITPVVAVLRSNLWLTIHVLTIVASYGALALTVVLAHVDAVQFVARRNAGPSSSSINLYTYRALQVGVVLLASGIMLGAVWANASWGRYWGWDPKETWALITLLWYLAILHGRYAGWVKGVGFSLATIAGFFLLLMTYYGVSFYLVGLHSYAGGNAKPIPVLLIGYLIAETVFLAVVGWVAFARTTQSGQKVVQ